VIGMKTLLLSDGSRYSLAAARALARWFGRPGLEVHILSVAPRMSRSPHRTYGTRKDLAAQWRAEARQWLDSTAGPLLAQGIRVKTHLRSGNPRETAVDWSMREFDLVVVGAKGREPTPFFDVGSVALSVLEHAPAPVLMVRAREVHPPVPDEAHPLRILVAVDDGLHSRRALEHLPRLLQLEQVEAEVLAVADDGYGGSLGWHDARRLSHHAAKILSDHAVPAEPRLESGHAAEAILAASEEADLLVLGSRSVEHMEERHMGSVALEVARSAPCSVLVLRHGHSGIVLGEGVEEPGRRIPFEVAWRKVRPSRRIERQILKAVEALEPLAPDALRCDVVVDQRNPRHRLGNLYQVRLELSRPGGRISVSRTPPDHTENENLVTAVGEAFQKLRRQILSAREVDSGKLKRHEALPEGVVTDLFPDYGFIRGGDGAVVYFHRNAVVEDAWDELHTGDRVSYRVEEGDLGPQAAHVSLVTTAEARSATPATL
jgi:nucleotide-binding universal stress UspA family protein/cold shock CspA family protein